MTREEEAFLDAHEATHYVWALHELNYRATREDIVDLISVARRIRKRNLPGPITSYVILAELNLYREEKAARILNFSKAVDFIVNTWRKEVKQTEEPRYADMTAEDAYASLMHIKQS